VQTVVDGGAHDPVPDALTNWGLATLSAQMVHAVPADE
jgi:hypothetical protein